ncbi:unnamed protein product [Ranitomeya imitator]|uniref:RING-type domain-containing protein n=1 Tax=Ranitomeya imitator TaxID=111125 RepID=A0ABN9M502_9NEOB|nr:unnamed protein product [Ranitomeya imitator]
MRMRARSQPTGGGKFYLLIEELSQLVRSLVPIQLWYKYIIGDDPSSTYFLGSILIILYSLCKSFDICGRIGGLRKALRVLCHPQGKVSDGQDLISSSRAEMIRVWILKVLRSYQPWDRKLPWTTRGPRKEFVRGTLCPSLIGRGNLYDIIVTMATIMTSTSILCPSLNQKREMSTSFMTSSTLCPLLIGRGLAASTNQTRDFYVLYDIIVAKYGVRASSQQCSEAGDICAICQADFKDPIILICQPEKLASLKIENKPTLPQRNTPKEKAAPTYNDWQKKYTCAGAVAEDQKRTSWKEDGRRRSGPETPNRPDQQRDCPWHVFCEECLCLWFDRERTCPLCRSVAVETLRLWKDGSTSAHFQVY